ncbi:MAG: hypothetical protein JNM94_04555 [Phycisphaerae bacterium]|nr:hypothetical protein [Phycisphaerae bacterium]
MKTETGGCTCSCGCHAEPEARRSAAELFDDAMALRARVGPTEEVLALFRAAVEGEERSEEKTLLADALLALGETILDGSGDRSASALQESIRCHQRAERIFRAAGRRQEAALCHLNTAVAYLSFGARPSSLKPKIAVQCLRAALADLDRESDGPLWESAVLNLANALQQIPPTTNDIVEGGNLVESVALYGELLEARRDDPDRHAYGRVAANLGCALGKLGRFDDAERWLHDARRELAADADAIEGIDGTLAEIAAARRRAVDDRSSEAGA